MAIYDERTPMAIMPARQAYRTLRFAFAVPLVMTTLDVLDYVRFVYDTKSAT